MNKIKLSVLCLTYNHAAFIRQALEGFIMQKTNFPFEVLIHDDASTDGTADIIREYEAKYPDIIKPVYQTENQYSKGVSISKNFQYPRIKGKYVALCEGDDYWTDENKLQKQVDFLENNQDFSICFHPVKLVWEDKSANDSIFPTPKIRFHKTVLNVDDLLKRNFIQTNSVVYRWAFSDGKYDKIPDNILPGDWFLHLLHAQTGKIGFIPDIMSVYRKHDGGIWFGCGESEDWFLRCGIPHMRFYKEIEKNFNVDREKKIIETGKSTISVLLKYKKFIELDNISQEFSSLWTKLTFLDANLNKKYRKLIKINLKFKAILGFMLLIIIYLFVSLFLTQ